MNKGEAIKKVKAYRLLLSEYLRRQINDRIEPILIEKDSDNGDFIGEIQKYGIEIA